MPLYGSVSRDLVAFGLATCVILPDSDHALACWGEHFSNPSTVNIPGGGRVSKFSTSGGASLHVCILTDIGEVKCLGRGVNGQLGNGGTSDSLSSLVEVTGSMLADDIAMGGSQTCALAKNGSVYCWGLLGFGGAGTVSTDVPVEVPMPSGSVVQVAVGIAHACALMSSGGVFCWGYGYDGQLGDGGGTICNELGRRAFCGHCTGYGTRYCRSALSSDKGDFPVVGIDNATQVVTGNYHSCALLSNGTVLCWGSGVYGVTGRESTEASNVPVRVNLNTSASFLAAGPYVTCATLENGAGSVCWGYGGHGQLGHDSTDNVGGLSGSMGDSLSPFLPASDLSEESPCDLVVAADVA